MSAWSTRFDLDVVPALLRSRPGLRDERSFVAHDLDLLERRFAELVAVMPGGALHAVAVKANPVVALLAVLVDLGAGLEAASIEEVHIALAAGCPPDRIVFDSPAKTTSELAEALGRGITVNVDNLDELDRALALPAHRDARLGVRIRPDTGAGTIAATSVGGRGSRFGIDVASLFDDVVPLIRRGAPVAGIHVHAGSQGQSIDQLVAAATVATDVAVRLREELGPDTIGFVDIGGGLATTYRSDEPAPDVAEYAAALRSHAPALFDGGLQVVTELGRALLAGTAIAVSRVEYVKRTGPDPDAETVLVGHLGADFLLRPAYVPDQWSHEFSLLDDSGRPRIGPAAPVTVAGPLCFAGDIIGRGVPLPAARPGDLVVIHDVGAYALSMWSRHCSRGLPLVVGHRRGGDDVEVLHAGETPADVARFWSRSAAPTADPS
jgi:diaminopimelate decarboxylase